jgi:hypothetical protein
MIKTSKAILLLLFKNKQNWCFFGLKPKLTQSLDLTSLGTSFPAQAANHHEEELHMV